MILLLFAGTGEVTPSVDAGHLVVHGGTLTPITTPFLSGAHLQTHGGALAPVATPSLRAAHLQAYGGTISVLVPGRTFALGPAIRGPVAYGPRITTGDIPPALTVRLYHGDDLNAEVAELTDSYGRRWQEQLNEVGSASIILHNDDPALALVTDGDVLRFELYGYAAFACLIRERSQVTLVAGEESAQATTLSGPGTLALLDTAVVYPARGVDSHPVEEDRVFTWVSVDFDDSAWSTAAALVRQDNVPPGPALVDPTGANGSYWENMPANWPDGSAWWIWADVPNALEWAPEGNCYFRKSFTVPSGTARLVYYVTFDGSGDLYLDGQLVASGEYGIEPDVKIYSATLDVSPGAHTIAIRCENDVDPEGDQVHNPGGVLFTAYAVDSADRWVSSAPLVHSDSSWKLVAYPPGPPGMTPGEVIRHVVEEAQARGALTPLSLNFSDDLDAEGVAWPVVTDLATKVGTDVLSFLREMSATYVDLFLEPADWRLSAYVRDGRGIDQNVSLAAADPTDPTVGNLVALAHKKV